MTRCRLWTARTAKVKAHTLRGTDFEGDLLGGLLADSHWLWPVLEEVQNPHAQRPLDAHVDQFVKQLPWDDRVKRWTEIQHEQHPGICAGGLEVLQNVMQGKRDSVIDGSVGPAGELVRIQLMISGCLEGPENLNTRPYSLNCYMPTLRLVHYALLLTPACWKSNNTNARLMAFAPSLDLDPTFGIHSHKTLDTVQPCHL